MTENTTRLSESPTPAQKQVTIKAPAQKQVPIKAPAQKHASDSSHEDDQ